MTTIPNHDVPDESDNQTVGVTIGSEAIPHLTKLVEAMREGRDRYFDDEAVEWAEFLIQCISDA